MTARLNYGPGLEGSAGIVHICGNFTTAAAANPTVFSSGPFTVVHTATGVYTITFKEQFSEFMSGDCQLLDATGSSKTCYMRSGASAPNPGTATQNATLVIETQSVAGTVADLTGPIVSFEVNWRKGTLRK